MKPELPSVTLGPFPGYSRPPFHPHLPPVPMHLIPSQTQTAKHLYRLCAGYMPFVQKALSPLPHTIQEPAQGWPSLSLGVGISTAGTVRTLNSKGQLDFGLCENGASCGPGRWVTLSSRTEQAPKVTYTVTEATLLCGHSHNEPPDGAPPPFWCSTFTGRLPCGTLGSQASLCSTWPLDSLSPVEAGLEVHFYTILLQS